MHRLPKLSAALAVAFAASIAIAQQFPEQNVNMVAGTNWPHGDPFLRQQNEGTVALSTRNRGMHLMGAANDYRSVDIPFNAPPRPDEEQTGDAWIGIFKSKDGGNTWYSDLLDGYPQLTNSASPLKGFQAAADPVVRAGDHGMFYVSGIVLNRGPSPLSAVFVSRFNDSDASEVGDPFVYIDTKLLDKGTPGQFIDKEMLAVSPLPNGTQCTVAGQTFAGQNLYLAYTVFLGDDANHTHTKLMFTRSTDCGQTWENAQKLSEGLTINQGAAIAVDPISGNVHCVWRRFQGGNDANSIIIATSTDQGKKFTKGSVVTNITPFEQGTSIASIRTNAYPTAAVDSNGRLYVAWSQRGLGPGGDARIVVMSSTDGTSWTAPAMVDASPQRGHQFMPAMTIVGGRPMIAYYDLREDHTLGIYKKNANGYDEFRQPVGAADFVSSYVFLNYLLDAAPSPGHLARRHTLDVRVAAAQPGPSLNFVSTRVTRFKFGMLPDILPPSEACQSALLLKNCIQQLQINPPNLPMFRQGSAAFIGDYIDIAGYVNGTSRVSFPVWTDNRDVRPAIGSPPDWSKYTPVNLAAPGTKSIFDPTQDRPPCDVSATGSRNQNIYTTRVTDGMFAGSPGNSKPLGTIKRAFAVFVQNARDTTAYYRLLVPIGGIASFLQFSALDHVDVTIPPHSAATRTVFVDGPAHSSVSVNVFEITGPGGTQVGGGQSATIPLNPDPTSPDIGNPDIGNPDIGNAEVFNPDIGNPDIGNPDIGNPDIGNPDIGNSDLSNPDIGNPDIGNPDIGNPDIGNPDIGNPDIGNSGIGNGSATDTNWPAKNQGNTTGGYTVKLFKNADLPAGVTSQLILNKIYDTPVARNCTLGVEHNRQIVTTINNPTFAQVGDLGDPSLNISGNQATIWLAPGETGRITIRLVDPNHKNVVLDASQFMTPVAISHSVNTQDANGENPTPAISLTILTNSLPGGMVGEAYNASLSAIGGKGTRTWTATGLPAGLTVSGALALISGTPQASGTFSVTITVTDQAIPPHVRSKTLSMAIIPALQISNASLPDGTVGQAYSGTVNTAGGNAPRFVTVTPSMANFGLAFDGVTISGTPVGVSDQSFTFTVTDSSAPTRSASKSLPIHVRQPLVITTQTVPDAIVGQFYSTLINASGGQPPYTWTVKAPPELSIDSNGVLQGTFAAPNSSFVTVTVKDAAQPTPRSASHQYDFNALLPITITSINPSTAAAGIGQLVALDVQGVPSLNGLHAYFKDSVNTIGEGFIFQSPSSTSRLFVRLPTQPSLVNGPLLVYLKNDSVTGPAASMTLAAIPGTPTIRFVLPTQPVIEGCPLVGSTPITEIASGIPIGVSAFGVDTVSAVLRFTQNNQFVDVFSQCDNNGDVIGVAAIFTVPQFNDGDIVIQIRTSVNQINSEWSAPVHLTVKNPS